MTKICICSALLLSICFLVGCGDGGSGAAILKRRSNLKTLGAAYLAFHQANGKSAASTSELADYMRQSTTDTKTTDAITSLEEGDIVIIWDGELSSEAQNATHVLGFEAGVPATGGYVVMGDGTVQLMTVKDYSEGTLLPSPGGER